jgi:hypothetical protein
MDERLAASWDDEQLRDVLIWRRVRARAEAGGFNGILIHDYRIADETIAALTALVPADRVSATARYGAS